ncbi:hypothetical protein [Segatella sp.]|uniref:hypothetical protein n=1 Tax=Segatella sp. TaxID=2974253 RepID=UPI003AB98B41
MVKGKSWCDKNIKIVAAGSNDSGVSWIVEVAGKRFVFFSDPDVIEGTDENAK